MNTNEANENESPNQKSTIKRSRFVMYGDEVTISRITPEEVAALKSRRYQREKSPQSSEKGKERHRGD